MSHVESQAKPMTASPAERHTPTVDVVIIGAGLAGCALAWSLRWRGVRVRLLDRGEPGTPSRIAAGLMTPITGMRLAVTWRMTALLAAANAFYPRVEAETGATFYHPRPAVRLFGEPGEVDILTRKGDQLLGQVDRLEPRWPPGWFAHPFGGFILTQAARLDVPTFLAVTQQHFAAEGAFQIADVQLPQDIEPSASTIRLPRWGLTTRYVVFCTGYQPQPNPWFPQSALEPAKGEILTVSIPELHEDRVIYAQGIWLAPIGAGRFRVGSTYDLNHLDTLPTVAGREELLSKLRRFVRLPIHVIGHDAAVRPVARSRKPLLGVHAEFPRLAYCNGLGSKGSLSVPYCAEMLAEHLLADAPLDPEVDLQRGRR
ncbi:MAG: FAD-binding oxidoreductase [Bacteroidales bacterium]|nr:FAD-binding oxidoreductase [Bacteroidales bacterium]